ncbi:dTDP-4-dehydrorhamnose 3,5-epimerase [[Clostridium] innocuum]|nr:dTDP-4-dehydrorhamnose 3,5-epimerase [[Clostridium] innocuum]
MVQKWNFQELDLKDAYLIKPFFASDDRGGLIKDYNIDVFKNHGINHELKEVFYTLSKKGVIRASHFQLIKQQPKLVRCVSGHVYDVIVDLRPDSPTCGQWRGFHLTAENMDSLLVPAYFGHGYLVIEDSIVSYKAADVFFGEGDSGIMYNDPDIGIEWPFELIGGKDNLIISDKDLNLMSFNDYKKIMESNYNKSGIEGHLQ